MSGHVPLACSCYVRACFARAPEPGCRADPRLRVSREEKVEEMPAKKYDAKQTAEALQRVVLVRCMRSGARERDCKSA